MFNVKRILFYGMLYLGFIHAGSNILSCCYLKIEGRIHCNKIVETTEFTVNLYL